MERSEIEHISIIPGKDVTFSTHCACGSTNHSLTVSVSKDTIKHKLENEETYSVSLDIEMFFEVFWDDRHKWDDIAIFLPNDSTWFEKIIANCKQHLAWFARKWNRIKMAWKVLTKGEIREEEVFIFRSGEQAEAVYKAIGDAIESFRNGEKEVDDLCDKYKNITKCRYVG